MKIAFISDLHCKQKEWKKRLDPSIRDEFDSCDVIVFAGDCTRIGRLETEAIPFLNWLNRQKAPHKIMVAGNHDFCFDTNFKTYTSLGDLRHADKETHNTDEDISSLISYFPTITYLNDSGVEIDGIKYWGSPISSWFHDWAFNRKDDIIEHWDMIPNDTDVLITHGNPKGILDEAQNGYHIESVGCHELLVSCYRVKPKIHVFGHIHEAYGTKLIDDMTFINASSLNASYDPVNPPIIVEV